MQTSTRESELWADARGGDSWAFGAVFDLHRDRVFRHARRLTESIPDAEDVVAMAFTDLWRRRDAVRVVEGSVLPWLLVTATNHTRNQLRGRRRYRTMLDGLPHSTAPDAGDVAASRLQAAERREALRAALQAVGPIDAALLVLTVLEDATTAQAAAAVGVTPQAARARLTRARRRLRALLETAGFGQEQ